MCPTCGHTVQRVNEGVSPKTWWCPRCGTLKTDGVPDSERPKVVKMAVANLQQVGAIEDRVLLWSKLVRIFGIGRTEAHEMCIALGVDPES